MKTLETEYRRVRDTPSDINEHCEMLRHLACYHNRVIELGTRYGVSTIALLAGRPQQMLCVDIKCQINVEEIRSLIANNPMTKKPWTEFGFILGSSLEV